MSLLMSWSRSPGFAAEFVIGRREDACSCRGRRWRNDRGKGGPAVANMLQRRGQSSPCAAECSFAGSKYRVVVQ